MKKESEAVVVEASTLKGTFEKAKKWFPKKEHSSECTRTQFSTKATEGETHHT